MTVGTTVPLYTEPINIEYLMTDIRLQFGDIDGSIFSDTVIRTSLVSGVRFLQKAWDGKYQIYSDEIKADPQPADVPPGYIRVNTLHGPLDIINTTVLGSIFRDPYATFTSASPPILEATDEEGIILAAVYILRRMQVTSNLGTFISWSTEDIRFSNLGIERGSSSLLEKDLAAITTFMKTKIAKPQRSTFPITYIPMLTELTYGTIY